MMKKSSAQNNIDPEFEKLYVFAERGDAESLQMILRSGITINFIHPNSTDSPLMIACRRGHNDVVKVCLDYGAKNDPHPDYGQTALHAAVSANQYECASILLRVAEESEADMIISNLTDQFGQTPLHSAATVGSVRLTELLLYHGAKIASVDSYGQTALHICAGLSNERCLAVLLDQGGDEYLEVTDLYGNTPLHHAAYNGRLECAKLLLETAANVSARNFKSHTPYNLASMQGHNQVGTLLLSYRDNSAWHQPDLNNSYGSLVTTPAGKTRPEEEYATPYTSERFGGRNSARGRDDSQNLAIGIPEMRRNTSSQSTSSRDGFDNLPRPYVVSSPAVNSKNLIKSRIPSTSATSSPVENSRKTSADYSNYNSKSQTNNKYEHENSYLDNDSSPGIVLDEPPVRCQLSTPLFVRSNPQQLPTSASSVTVGWMTKNDNDDASPAEYTNGSFHQDNTTPYAEESADEPNTYSENQYFDNYSAAHYTTSTPLKGQSGPYLQSVSEEDEFADALEIFEACGMTWYVYLTEQQDIYYLDMVNSHSQWEDPRQYGIIHTYDDLPPDSPSKLSDTAPPLSPAFRSPTGYRYSPSISNTISPASRLSDGQSVTKKFSFIMEDIDGEGGLTTPDDTTTTPCSSAVLSGQTTSSSLLNNDTPPRKVFTRAHSPSSSSSSDDEHGEVVEYTIRSNLSRQRQAVRRINPDNTTATTTAVANEPNCDSNKPSPGLRKSNGKNCKSVRDHEDQSNASKAIPITRKIANLKNNWIQEPVSAKPSETVAYFNQPTLSEQSLFPEQPLSNAVTATSTSANIIADETSMRKECTKYASLIIEGHQTAQEIRTLLDLEKRSQQFVSLVLSIVDEAIMDKEFEQQFTSEPPTTPVQNATNITVNAEERKQTLLKELEIQHPAIFGKYMRMLKMGVAEMNVLNKMKIDQQSKEHIGMMEQALGLTEDKENTAAIASQPARAWQLVPENRLKNSIWAFAKSDNSLGDSCSSFSANSEQPSNPTAHLPEEELQELEALFFTNSKQLDQQQQGQSDVSQKLQTKKQYTLRILESKRAQNIVIGLVAFKAFGSHVELLKAICKLNTFHDLITLDRLENFQHLLPTESELKLTFKLKDVSHPAEVFLQTLLIFYPELPVRLNTFIICLAIPNHVQQTEKRFQVIMDIINQIISSPKLAKVLPKLLMLGEALMNEGNGTNGNTKPKSKAGAKVQTNATLLEQLLQICSTKGLDKKTSLLDYMVKTFYDKNEESLLLGVIEDLSLLSDNTLPIASLEAFQGYATCSQLIQQLDKELERNGKGKNSTHDTLLFNSPTAKAMSDEYSHRLEEYLQLYTQQDQHLTKRKMLFVKKIRQLMEYFGEDPKKEDTFAIFNALREFRRALAFSKEQLEWKLHRAQQPQQ